MLRELSGVKRIIIKTGRTDLRRGIDGLASMVRLQYGMDPMENGTLFLFCGTRRDRIKGLIYEEGGWLLLYFRLSRGSVFQWPHSSDEAKAITQEQYEHLLDGFSLESSIHKDTGQTTGMKSK